MIMLNAWKTFLAGSKSFRSFLIAGLSALFLSLTLWGVWHGWIKTSTPTCSGDFDLVIVGAEIITGLGDPPIIFDLGIRGRRIACIGVVDRKMAKQVIDATGLSVAPGFIDVHTHIERNLPSRSGPLLAPNFVRQGVTTIISGNCGRSFTDINKAFQQIESDGSQVNLATLVGHNTVRQAVMSHSAASPTAAELASMKKLVRAGMADGALGISTGLEYIPGVFAKRAELVELARTVHEMDGVYVSHIRDEGINGLAAIEETLSIARDTGIHVHISHFKVQGPNQWGTAAARLNLLTAAQQDGIAVSLDQYPYTASSTGVAVLLPSWVSADGHATMKQRLGNPTTRANIRSQMLEQLRVSGWKDYSFARVSYCRFDHSIVGMSIPEIARTHLMELSHKVERRDINASLSTHRNQSHETALEQQADAVIDLFERGDTQMVFFNMSARDVESILKDPRVMIGSDSGVREDTTNSLPHPRGLGTFPKIVGGLARQQNLFSIEEAIRRMTSLPAATFGLIDRGQIKEGFYADLVVFDRDRIIDTATYDKPLSTPEGIYYVVVNGSLVSSGNSLTKLLPGMAIRHQRNPIKASSNKAQIGAIDGSN